MAVIGINGSGKSTLLKTLIGELPAVSGSVLLNEKKLTTFSPKSIAEHISIVLTDTHFSKNLSVQEVVALGRHPYTNWLGKMSTQDKKAVTDALHIIGLTDKAHRACHRLSDGQLQKVMLARALAQDTQLIMLDEPTTHLDLYHKAFVLKLLKNLSQETQKAIVFATHELNLALQLCDQIVLVNEENVLQASPEELISTGALEKLFPKDLVRFDAHSKSFKLVE